jgi:integrase
MAACDPWTEPEMIALLESTALSSGIRSRNRCLFALQCATGARISEVLSLARRAVVDDLGRLSSRISFTNTKNGETRHVDLVNPFATPFLREWLSDLESMGFVRGRTPLFVATDGARISRGWWYKVIKAACRECRLPGHYGTHSARKTWARDTYKHYHARAMSGELVDPLLKLQEAGGWKTIEAARRYISFMLGDTSRSQAALFPELQKRYGK